MKSKNENEQKQISEFDKAKYSRYVKRMNKVNWPPLPLETWYENGGAKA